MDARGRPSHVRELLLNQPTFELNWPYDILLLVKDVTAHEIELLIY